MKKIIFIMLFSLLFTGCGAESQPEQVNLLIKVPALQMTSISNDEVIDAETFMNLAVSEYRKTHENVNVIIDVVDMTDMQRAVTGTSGTDSAPDIVFGGYLNIAGYVYYGNVVPLDDIITNEMRHDISDYLWAQGEINGKTYLIPFMSYQNIMSYNKELFRECGLDKYISKKDYEIQNWSIDDWNIILDTLAEKLPAGSYPMMMYAGDDQGDTHIMALLSAFGGNMYTADGKFDFESEEIIKALTWIRDGVDRGWYMPHSENLVISDNHDKFNAGELALYHCNNANINTDGIEQGYVNFPGNTATSFVTGFEVMDNGDDEKLATAKDFVKFIYNNDTLLECSAGEIPASNKVAKKYASQIDMLGAFSVNSSNIIDFMNGSANWQGSSDGTSVRDVFWVHIHELLAGDVSVEECAKRLNEDCNQAIAYEGILHE